MKLRIILGLTVLTILSFVLVSSTSYSKSCACDYVSTPSPEVTVTPSPTDEPTASPSATPVETESPSPTPTDNPCFEFKGEFPEDCPTSTPEPPVVTPEPQQPSSKEAEGQPSCQTMDTPTILTFNRPTPNQVHVTWSNTGNISNYVIWYGTSEFQLPWNTTVQNAHEVTLNDVPLENLWIKVAANDGICTGNFSVTLDP